MQQAENHTAGAEQRSTQGLHNDRIPRSTEQEHCPVGRSVRYSAHLDTHDLDEGADYPSIPASES